MTTSLLVLGILNIPKLCSKVASYLRHHHHHHHHPKIYCFCFSFKSKNDNFLTEKRCCTQSWVLKLFPQILHLNLLICSHHYLVFTTLATGLYPTMCIFCTSSQAKLQQLCKNNDVDNKKRSITSCCSSLSTMRRVIVSSGWQRKNGSDEHSLFFTIM